MLSYLPLIGLFIAGVLHLTGAPAQFDHAPAHGLFFIGVGTAQVLWTASHFWRRDYRNRVTLVTGVALSGGVVAIWLLSHTIATPFAPEPHLIDSRAITTVIAELAAFGGILWFAVRKPIVGTRSDPRSPGASAKTVVNGRAVARPYTVSLIGGLAAAIGVWLIGVVIAPQFPSLNAVAHGHGNEPVPGVIVASAYFTIVNATGETDVLTGGMADGVERISLHETQVNADQVARMSPLTQITVPPNARVEFAPGARHVMLEGLPRDLVEGDSLDVMLHFASGREVTFTFDVRLLDPETRINFQNVEGFQITNAWIRATASADGLVSVSDGGYDWRLPPGFPLPRVPVNNPMTEEKVELGRYLFYDESLSGNGGMSCASCHHQERAFSEPFVRSVGSTGQVHPRNASSLVNTAYNATLTWANPNLTQLERQIVIPMFGEHPIEMGITGNEEQVLARFERDPQYRSLFAQAFAEQDNPVTFENIGLALSSFTRTLISGDSPYDRYLRGEREALSTSARRGMDLFFSESLECHHCHTGFNMTLSTVTANSTFEEQPFFNTGLYNVGGTGAYPSDNTGIFEITNNPNDMGRFRPPTLRNIALTAPYMHDGTIATLRDVIDFYADGGRVIASGPHAGDGRANPYQSGLIAGFTLEDGQINDLIAFLESLTDESFIRDERFSDPFVADMERAAQIR